MPREGQLLLAQGTGTSGKKYDLGLSKEHLWLLLPNVQMETKKQVRAADWKLGREESIEEIVLLATPHCISTKHFPETGNF